MLSEQRKTRDRLSTFRMALTAITDACDAKSFGNGF